MSQEYFSPHSKQGPYIPRSLSEIYDLLGSMILSAPTFHHPAFPQRNVDSEFYQLIKSFAVVRKKLGDERYGKLVDLAARAKILFAEDQKDTNGKSTQGRALLHEIEKHIQETRRSRKSAKLTDDDGEISGD